MQKPKQKQIQKYKGEHLGKIFHRIQPYQEQVCLKRNSSGVYGVVFICILSVEGRLRFWQWLVEEVSNKFEKGEVKGPAFMSCLAEEIGKAKECVFCADLIAYATKGGRRSGRTDDRFDNHCKGVITYG